MGNLFLPFIFSLAALGAGFLCRYKGARFLLIGMGGLTAVAIVAVVLLQAIAGGLGCTGSSFRAMSCPEGSSAAQAIKTIGGFASLLTLPGLVIGPIAAPIAGLAEYWTRRNTKA